MEQVRCPINRKPTSSSSGNRRFILNQSWLIGTQPSVRSRGCFRCPNGGGGRRSGMMVFGQWTVRSDDIVRGTPRTKTLAEHSDGLWTTGRPDDPRRSTPRSTWTRLTVLRRSPQSLPSSQCSAAEFIYFILLGSDSSLVLILGVIQLLRIALFLKRFICRLYKS